jgi:hypothetical protein
LQLVLTSHSKFVYYEKYNNNNMFTAIEHWLQWLPGRFSG